MDDNITQKIKRPAALIGLNCRGLLIQLGAAKTVVNEVHPSSGFHICFYEYFDVVVSYSSFFDYGSQLHTFSAGCAITPLN